MGQLLSHKKVLPECLSFPSTGPGCHCLVFLREEETRARFIMVHLCERVLAYMPRASWDGHMTEGGSTFIGSWTPNIQVWNKKSGVGNQGSCVRFMSLAHMWGSCGDQYPDRRNGST